MGPRGHQVIWASPERELRFLPSLFFQAREGMILFCHTLRLLCTASSQDRSSNASGHIGRANCSNVCQTGKWFQMNDSQHSSRWVEIHAQGTSIVRWEMARMKDGKAACAWMSRSALGETSGCESRLYQHSPNNLVSLLYIPVSQFLHL